MPAPDRRVILLRGTSSRSGGAAHALGQDAGGQFRVAQQIQQDRPRSRALGRVRIKALRRHCTEPTGQADEVGVAAWRATSCREYHGLGPGQNVRGWRRCAIRRRDAKLDHTWRAIGRHDDVLRAKITVHKAGLVDRCQAGSHADGDRLEIWADPNSVGSHNLQQ